MSIPFSGYSQWIGSPLVGGAFVPVPAPYFRKTFILDQLVSSARVVVTALGLYELEINGRVVGDQVFAPGWTDYKKRVMYQVHDVSSFLHQGENVIGAVLGDGWYCGHVGWMKRQYYGDRPQLLVTLTVVLADGSTCEIGSDATWKTSTGPLLANDLIMGEAYDARLEAKGWSEPGFDDTTWIAALPMPAYAGEFSLSPGPSRPTG